MKIYKLNNNNNKYKYNNNNNKIKLSHHQPTLTITNIMISIIKKI